MVQNYSEKATSPNKEKKKNEETRLVIGTRACMYVCMYGHTYSKSMDQPGKVANPARGQPNREILISLYAFAPGNLVSRDGFGSLVPRQPAHIHTQTESGAYLFLPSSAAAAIYLF